MTINWQDLLTNIGSTGVIVAAMTWLAKTLLSDRLARQVEAFKIELKANADAANERVKNSLHIMALEHQVRFSKLHEKRAEVIDELYKRLVALEGGHAKFVIFEDPGSTETFNAMSELSRFIQQHRIYLPAPVCDSLKEFVDLMWQNVTLIKMQTAPGPRTTDKMMQKREQVISEAYRTLLSELPTARTLLENEFRRMLGVEVSHIVVSESAAASRA